MEEWAQFFHNLQQQKVSSVDQVWPVQVFLSQIQPEQTLTDTTGEPTHQVNEWFTQQAVQISWLNVLTWILTAMTTELNSLSSSFKTISLFRVRLHNLETTHQTGSSHVRILYQRIHTETLLLQQKWLLPDFVKGLMVRVMTAGCFEVFWSKFLTVFDSRQQ